MIGGVTMTTFAIALTSVIIIAALLHRIFHIDREDKALLMWETSTITDVKITNSTSDFVSHGYVHWTRF